MDWFTQVPQHLFEREHSSHHQHEHLFEVNLNLFISISFSGPQWESYDLFLHRRTKLRFLLQLVFWPRDLPAQGVHTRRPILDREVYESSIKQLKIQTHAFILVSPQETLALR